MYNGIGLQTPRGSGTNGHVQRNWALVRTNNKDKLTYHTEAELAALDVASNRQPNKEILDHERKRKIELKCVELEEILEEKGYDQDVIEKKVENYRNMLMGHDDKIDITRDVWGRINVTETHQVAQAQQEKNAKLREAFGISEYFVDGSSFDPARETKEQMARANALREQEKQKDLEDSKKYDLVHTPSPEPYGDKKKIKKRKSKNSSSSEEPKKKKKGKKHKKDRLIKAKDKKKTKRRRRKSTSESEESSSSEDSYDSNSENEKRKKRRMKKKEKRMSKKKRHSSTDSTCESSPEPPNKKGHRNSKTRKDSNSKEIFDDVQKSTKNHDEHAKRLNEDKNYNNSNKIPNLSNQDVNKRESRRRSRSLSKNNRSNSLSKDRYRDNKKRKYIESPKRPNRSQDRYQYYRHSPDPLIETSKSHTTRTRSRSGSKKRKISNSNRCRSKSLIKYSQSVSKRNWSASPKRRTSHSSARLRKQNEVRYSTSDHYTTKKKSTEKSKSEQWKKGHKERSASPQYLSSTIKQRQSSPKSPTPKRKSSLKKSEPSPKQKSLSPNQKNYSPKRDNSSTRSSFSPKYKISKRNSLGKHNSPEKERSSSVNKRQEVSHKISTLSKRKSCSPKKRSKSPKHKIVNNRKSYSPNIRSPSPKLQTKNFEKKSKSPDKYNYSPRYQNDRIHDSKNVKYPNSPKQSGYRSYSSSSEYSTKNKKYVKPQISCHNIELSKKSKKSNLESKDNSQNKSDMNINLDSYKDSTESYKRARSSSLSSKSSVECNTDKNKQKLKTPYNTNKESRPRKLEKKLSRGDSKTRAIPMPIVRLRSSIEDFESDNENENIDEEKEKEIHTLKLLKSDLAAKAKEVLEKKIPKKIVTDTNQKILENKDHFDIPSFKTGNSPNTCSITDNPGYKIELSSIKLIPLKKTNTLSLETKIEKKDCKLEPIKIAHDEFDIKAKDFIKSTENKEPVEKINSDVSKFSGGCKRDSRSTIKTENVKRKSSLSSSRSRSRSCSREKSISKEKKSRSSSRSSYSSRHHSHSSSSNSSRSRSHSPSASRSSRTATRSRSRSQSSSTSSTSSRSNSRSRSPSIPRRHGSPSFLDRRRITSARKRPIPYHRPTPSSPSSVSSWSSRNSSPWYSRSSPTRDRSGSASQADQSRSSRSRSRTPTYSR